MSAGVAAPRPAPSMTAAVLHYSHAPVIGGVETVVRRHAELLAAEGWGVRVVFGDGGGGGAVDGLEECRVPEMSARHPEVVALQNRLAAAVDRPDAWERQDRSAFESLVGRLVDRLREVLSGVDVVIAHNLMVMPFHLALTQALWRLADEVGTAPGGRRRWLCWVHDLAAAREGCDRHGDRAGPAGLLFKAHPSVDYVAVSELRREQTIRLLGVPPERCHLVPNGIDPAAFLPPLQPALARLAERDRWLERDLVLLHPARLVPRKNIEFGIQVTAALCDAGIEPRYLVTAAEDPHRSGRDDPYAAKLRAMVAERQLESRVLFLSDTAPVADEDLPGLYAVADALFLPSREEGFGLPLMEAAVARLPVFCSNLEPLAAILSQGGSFFKLSDNPLGVAQSLLNWSSSWPEFQVRKRVVRRYSWPQIFQQHLRPLLTSA